MKTNWNRYYARNEFEAFCEYINDRIYFEDDIKGFYDLAKKLNAITFKKAGATYLVSDLQMPELLQKGVINTDKGNERGLYELDGNIYVEYYNMDYSKKLILLKEHNAVNDTTIIELDSDNYNSETSLFYPTGVAGLAVINIEYYSKIRNISELI